MRQNFIKESARFFITKCDRFITKCDSYYKLQRFYYKMRELLQNVTFITICARITGYPINRYHATLMPVFSYFVTATTAQFASSQVTTKHQERRCKICLIPILIVSLMRIN